METPVRMAMVTLAACSFLIACSSGGRSEPVASAPAPQQSAHASTTPAAACNAPIQGVDVSTWQLVTLKTFTYCIPPGWRGGGSSWRIGRTSLDAGTGTPPRKRVGVVRRVEMARPGQPLMTPEPPPGSETRRSSEVIGGKAANLYRNHFNGTNYVSAVWDSPATWITAETPDSDTADLVLQIARTVRFTGQ